MKRRICLISFVFFTLIPLSGEKATRAASAESISLAQLHSRVNLIEDSDGVPHIFAADDHDVYFMMGYLHARDRLFQMDESRRLFSGTLAELTGKAALPSDIQLRTLGLRRAAQESLDAYSPEAREVLQAYSDGVNAFIQDQSQALPPEYAELELTKVEPWTPLDSVTIVKGTAFGLSFDIDDISRTQTLAAYQQAGSNGGFDGDALFFQDLFRVAPFDPTVSIPQPAPAAVSAVRSRALKAAPREGRAIERISPETLRLVHQYLEKIRQVPLLRALQDGSSRAASNWWLVDAAHSQEGAPLLANDPHLSLSTPPIFYEIHLSVSNDPRNGPMNVNGVSFAGVPAIAQGCNDRICWGSTVNPMDVTDVFEEKLDVDIIKRVPTGTRFDGEHEPIVTIQQTFRANLIDDGTQDHLETESVGALEGKFTFLVPRRNMGPIISVDTSNLLDIRALSVQFTGFRATHELESFLRWARAGNLQDFKEGLQFFDFGSQNFAYADRDGNIAYFTGGELPLREDLQEQGKVDGMPPFLVRDGTHQHKNEWLPVEHPQPLQALEYEILPFDEMPQLVNPPQGFIASANNDPVGTTLDNDDFNQTRPGGGVFYLNAGYTSLRVGQITRLLKKSLENGGKLSQADMQAIQANNQLPDAEVFLPYLLDASTSAGRSDAPAMLAALGNDPAVQEALNRLADWDFSTPTGIAEGYDPFDDPDQLPNPSQQEIDNSVAATLYSVWRGRILHNVIDGTLERIGLSGQAPDSERSLTALRNLLDHFAQNQGMGASGVDFFKVDGISSAPDARDFLLLKSLRDALDLLAGDAFAPAFNHSTDQSDYRWGRLHRIVFHHDLGSAFNIPPAGGFSDLSPELPGLPRSGGYETIDASSHSARASGANAFMFGSGPARRFVGVLSGQGVDAREIIPGGESGIPGNPFRANQLGRWLTNHYHPLLLSRDQVEQNQFQARDFLPTLARLFFPLYKKEPGTFAGFAFTNLTSSDLNLELTARDEAGSLNSALGKPMADLMLMAHKQSAKLGVDLFEASPQSSPTAWIEVKAPVTDGFPEMGPPLSSFVQFGTFDLRRMDGAVALANQYQELFFTRILEGAGVFRGQDVHTLVSLANPNDVPIQLNLRLVQPGQADLEGSMSIPAHGFKAGTVSDLLDTSPTVASGYLQVRVVQGPGVAGFEAIQLDNGSMLLGLNGSPGSGASESFSAQLAAGGLIFTNLRLVNTSPFDRDISISGVDDDGMPLTDPVQLSLAPGEAFQQDAADLFKLSASASKLAAAAATIVTGSIDVTASGPGVIGDVIFGDPQSLKYAAALPLQIQPYRSIVFPQVANIGQFFTGLAFFNPGTREATVHVEVRDKEGAKIGENDLHLGPGMRISKQLVELGLVPEGSQQSDGYVVVSSDEPIVAQEFFGTTDLKLLSSVPPTVVR